MFLNVTLYYKMSLQGKGIHLEVNNLGFSAGYIFIYIGIIAIRS